MMISFKKSWLQLVSKRIDAIIILYLALSEALTEAHRTIFLVSKLDAMHYVYLGLRLII